MFDFKNENSALYKKGIIIVLLIMLISMILVTVLDDSSYEIYFRLLWFISSLLWIFLLGMQETLAKKK